MEDDVWDESAHGDLYEPEDGEFSPFWPEYVNKCVHTETLWMTLKALSTLDMSIYAESGMIRSV